MTSRIAVTEPGADATRLYASPQEAASSLGVRVHDVLTALYRAGHRRGHWVTDPTSPLRGCRVWRLGRSGLCDGCSARWEPDSFCPACEEWSAVALLRLEDAERESVELLRLEGPGRTLTVTWHART
jgi:hypothetical protein